MSPAPTVPESFTTSPNAERRERQPRENIDDLMILRYTVAIMTDVHGRRNRKASGGI